MKALAILLCMYMVSLASSLPIISKPLEDNPDHLVWEALLTIDTHRSDDKTRKIPKSIFITPNLNESKGNCAPDHKLGPDGRCYKTLQIDPLLMLKKQIESLLKNNRTATTEYEDDYDYSEYGESTESMNSNGQYTVPLSFGFGGENRIPEQKQEMQQTTFPNLNRVVKDDSHVSPIVPTTTGAATATITSATSATPTASPSSPATTVATTSAADTDNREVNQPFRASTTGIDLDTEEVISESRIESIASAATSSSTAPSSTTVYTVDTASNETSSTNANDQEHEQNLNPPEPMAKITFESLIDENSSTQASSSIRSVSVTETPEESTENSSVESHSVGYDDVSKTEPVEIITSPVDTVEVSEKTTEAVVPAPTPKVENIETPETVSMASSTESHELNNDQTELTGQSSNVEAISTEATTKQSVKTEDKSNPLLSSSTETNSESVQPIEQKANQAAFVEEFQHKSISPQSLDLKLPSKLSTEQPGIGIETESSTVPVPTSTQKPTESSSTIADKVDLPEKSDSFEVVEAYFIPSPSEIPEEIDPAIGKNVSGSAAERKESVSAIFDDELPEAELAPVIDTSANGRSNIELVKSSDGSAGAQFDDVKKNLSARLAEELLFQGPDVMLFNDRDSVPTKPVQAFNAPGAVKSDSLVKLSGKTVDFEDALSGGVAIEAAPIGSGAVLGSDSTTQEPFDYDSIRFPTESAIADTQSDSRNVGYEGQLPVREAVPFSGESEEHFFQQVPQPSPPPAQPSIYSTFISRLKVAPPFVELHDQHPKTVQYSHSPFDIAPHIQNANPIGVDGVAIASAPTTAQPTFTLHNDDRNFKVDQPTPVHGKSLQIGINCYVKNLDKQQYIICDDA